MTGQMIINNIDIAESFGAYLQKGELKNLLPYAPMKTPKSNDWYEADGLEVDLSQPKLDDSEVALTFIIKGDTAMARRFADFLRISESCVVFFAYRRFDLLYKELKHLEANELFCRVTLSFVKRAYRPIEKKPVKSQHKAQENYMDDINLGFFGLTLLKGYRQSYFQNIKTKDGLKLSLKAQDGNRYDTKGLKKLKSRDFQLTFLLRVDNFEDLWRNYDSFFTALIQPNERVLKLEYIDEMIHCFYKSCRVDEYHNEGTLWLKFTITLTTTR